MMGGVDLGKRRRSKAASIKAATIIAAILPGAIGHGNGYQQDFVRRTGIPAFNPPSQKKRRKRRRRR